MRTTARALAVLLLAAAGATGLSLTSAAPARACSCHVAETDWYVDHADLVVAGEVVPPTEPGGLGEKTAYTVRPEEVYKSDLPDGETLTVRTGASGAACGASLVEGRQYVLFADAVDRDEGVYRTSLCSGTERATDRAVQELEAVTGPGDPVSGQSAAGPAPESGTASGADTGAGTGGGDGAPSPAALDTGAAAGDDGFPTGWVLLGVAGAAVVGAGTWLLLGRRPVGPTDG